MGFGEMWVEVIEEDHMEFLRSPSEFSGRPTIPAVPPLLLSSAKND